MIIRQVRIIVNDDDNDPRCVAYAAKINQALRDYDSQHVKKITVNKDFTVIEYIS